MRSFCHKPNVSSRFAEAPKASAKRRPRIGKTDSDSCVGPPFGNGRCQNGSTITTTTDCLFWVYLKRTSSLTWGTTWVPLHKHTHDDFYDSVQRFVVCTFCRHLRFKKCLLRRGVFCLAQVPKGTPEENPSSFGVRQQICHPESHRPRLQRNIVYLGRSKIFSETTPFHLRAVAGTSSPLRTIH